MDGREFAVNMTTKSRQKAFDRAVALNKRKKSENFKWKIHRMNDGHWEVIAVYE